MDAENVVRVVNVFVSSPSDVSPKRGRVQAVAAKLNRDYEGLVRFNIALWEKRFYKANRGSLRCDAAIGGAAPHMARRCREQDY